MQNRDWLNKGKGNSNVLIRVGITLIVGLLGLAAGLGLASTVLDSSNDSGLERALRNSQTKVSQMQAEVQGLQTDLEAKEAAYQVLVRALDQASLRGKELRSQLSQAEAQTVSSLRDLAQKESELEQASSARDQIATLEEQILSIQSQVVKEQANLEALREMSDAIERHRLLLVELRKDVPDTREETYTYWSNIKTLAAKANPALTSPADRVILKIDNYFDWNDRSPNPTIPRDEYVNAYVDWLADFPFSGAEAYIDATDSFTKDALLTVITQMDSVVGRLN